MEITTMAMNIARTAIMAIAMMQLEPSDTVTAGRHPSCVLLPGLPSLSIILASTRIINGRSVKGG